MSITVRVGKRGTIVIPKKVREKLGIKDGDILTLHMEGNRIIIETMDLWNELRKRSRRLKMSAEELERELDEEDVVWTRKLEKL